MNAVIDLPRPISTNDLWVNIPGKGRARSQRYRTWLRAAGWAVKAARVRQFVGPVQITLTVEEKYRGDLDNCWKAVLDCLEACGVVVNDRQFRRIIAQFGPVDGMRAEIAPLEGIAA